MTMTDAQTAHLRFLTTWRERLLAQSGGYIGLTDEQRGTLIALNTMIDWFRDRYK